MKISQKEKWLVEIMFKIKSENSIRKIWDKDVINIPNDIDDIILRLITL